MFAAYSAGMLLAAAMAVSSPSTGQAIAAPALASGDTWSYRTTDQWSGRAKSESTLTVLGVMGEYVRMAVETRAFASNGQSTLAAPYEMTNRTNFDTVYMANGKASARINFAWPLFPGKRWNYEYAVSSPGSTAVVTFRISAEVTGWEDVATTVGKFRTLKVIHTGTADAGAGLGISKTSLTFWYAPEAKNYVRYQTEVTGPDGAPGTRENSELTAIRVQP